MNIQKTWVYDKLALVSELVSYDRKPPQSTANPPESGVLTGGKE